MINKIKNAVYNVVNNDVLPFKDQNDFTSLKLPVKYPYCRPQFLGLCNEDEIALAEDHQIRPIIVPREISILPWNCGYAEAVNAGKSFHNEDQAAFYIGCLQHEINPISSDKIVHSTYNKYFLPYYYFGIFDGHAGTGAAIAASKQLHGILHTKLMGILKHHLPQVGTAKNSELSFFIPLNNAKNQDIKYIHNSISVTDDQLIIGALESSFQKMDQIIGEDKTRFRLSGGCTALVALFILGKVYIANAGDSRAVMCNNLDTQPLSHDFTAQEEQERIRQLAMMKPEVLGNTYTYLDYGHQIMKKDLGKFILYREPYMVGWTYKIADANDLKLPLISGIGKRSRLLGTIGVTRGFGDHDIHAQGSGLLIKPFLTSQPEIQVVDLCNKTLSEKDILILATDGLWDVLDNQQTAVLLRESFQQWSDSIQSDHNKYRYLTAAQDLVMYCRGQFKESSWKCVNGSPATVDDISTFIIPLKPYQDEYKEWKEEILSKLFGI